MSWKTYTRITESITGWVTIGLVGLFIATMAAGWVMNVRAVWNATALDGETIVRAIAIILWPIGCIIGWFT